jgi:hypothetical protein
MKRLLDPRAPPLPPYVSVKLPHVSPYISFLSSFRTARWSTRRDPSLIQLCIPSGISNQYLKAGAWRPPPRHRGIDALTRWQVGWAGGNSANLTICSPGLTDALLSDRDFSRSDRRVCRGWVVGASAHLSLPLECSLVALPLETFPLPSTRNVSPDPPCQPRDLMEHSLVNWPRRRHQLQVFPGPICTAMLAEGFGVPSQSLQCPHHVIIQQ